MDQSRFYGEWEIIPSTNDKDGPSPRCGHTLTIHGRNTNSSSPTILSKLLVAFGESSLLSDREYYDDMYIFDLETRQWTQILGSESTNYRNTITIPERLQRTQNKIEKLYNQNSNKNENKPNLNHLSFQYKYKYHNRTHNKSKRNPFLSRNNYRPIPRADHAATSFGTNNDRVLLFGGKCKDTYLDDLILVRNIASFKSSIIDYENDIYYDYSYEYNNIDIISNNNDDNNNNNTNESNNCNYNPRSYFNVLSNKSKNDYNDYIQNIDYSSDDSESMLFEFKNSNSNNNIDTNFNDSSMSIEEDNNNNNNNMMISPVIGANMTHYRKNKMTSRINIKDTKNSGQINKKSEKPIRIEPIHLAKGPCGRRGASLTYWKEGSFLLFGGQRGSIFLNDLWGLDLHKQGWVELPTRNNPSPRAFHSAFVDDQQKILILGGVKDTQANPVSPDIFKLDLRAGKFMKLGDKDMVPGLEEALTKGHHSSHFLPKHSDLVIYAPQNASTYILGGNTQSPHCGKCCHVHASVNNYSRELLHIAQDNNNNINDTSSSTTITATTTSSTSSSRNRASSAACGTCRPSTIVLSGTQSPSSMKSYSWNDQLLERLFVFGGYVPGENKCSKHVRSLKFSTQPCNKHHISQTQSTATPAIMEAIKQAKFREKQRKKYNVYMKKRKQEKEERRQQEEQEEQEAQFEEEEFVENNNFGNFDFNRSNETNSISLSLTSKTKTSIASHNNNNNNNNNEFGNSLKFGKQMNVTPMRHFTHKKTMPCTPLSSFKIDSNSPMSRHRHVILSRTPVRSHSSPQLLLKTLESQVSKQKISRLDPALLDINDDHHMTTNKQPLHWQVIRNIIISPHESILDKRQPFMLSPSQIYFLCKNAFNIFCDEETLIRIEPPIKVFGDIHGQLGDLMTLFKAFGQPDHILGDINIYKYIFLGDFVDRGHKSLEVMCLLLALKVQYPKNVFLIRGNHECHAMNELYGFHAEIKERILCDETDICNDLESLIGNDNNYYINTSDDNTDDDDSLTDNDISDNYLLKVNNDFTSDEGGCDQDCTTDEEEDNIRKTKSRMKSKLKIKMKMKIKKKKKKKKFSYVNNQKLYNNSNNHKYKFCDQSKTNLKYIINKHKNRIIFKSYNAMEETLKECFNKIFGMLPLSALIGDKILCVHGGIGEIKNISEISNLERPCNVVCDANVPMNSEERSIVDVLWSDPAETDEEIGFHENKRGVSCVFGSDIVRSFCKNNGIDLIIRAHQVVKDGYEYFAGGHLITVFSATNYCDVMDNAGAILCIGHDLRVVPKLVEPRQEYNESEWRDVGQAPSPMRGTQNTTSYTNQNNNNNNNNIWNSNNNNNNDNENNIGKLSHTVRHVSDFTQIEQKMSESDSIQRPFLSVFNTNSDNNDSVNNSNVGSTKSLFKSMQGSNTNNVQSRLTFG